MNGMHILLYIALAVLYGGIASSFFAGAAWVIGARSPLTRTVPTLFTILVFVFLTQHPFPSHHALACPVPEAEANFVPLGDMGQSIAQDLHRGTSLKNVLTNAGVGVTLMNLLAGIAIGAALTRHRVSVRTAVFLGFALSLTVELTQLTGIWGFYPCAYRKFDVDDLLTNTLGVGLGYAMWPWWLRSRKMRRLI